MELSAFDSARAYLRAHYVVTSHNLMEKALNCTYKCISGEFAGNSFVIEYNNSVIEETDRILLSGDDYPDYLMQAFAPATEEKLREAVKNGESLTKDTKAALMHFIFYGEHQGKSVKCPTPSKCPHSIVGTYGSWCLRCRMAQQIPARLMKKIRGADRNFLKTFNPVQGGVNVAYSKAVGDGMMKVTLSGKYRSPELAARLPGVTGYTDKLSEKSISVKIDKCHLHILQEQRRLAAESLSDDKKRQEEKLLLEHFRNKGWIVKFA